MATQQHQMLQIIIQETNNSAKDKYVWLLKFLAKRGEIGAVLQEEELFEETFDDEDPNW
eukprot:CAMPEP_0168570066 /NCGR_PEP_ID=MMETSP0413-20121227/16519_1 /TAXON_ID=136452 /ORGANISM="Filamoeba nolandi, Strain NC-AS-23-1" /LENGTH=58 /DNA_ID=CAMNT_0008602657 /DNA_START=11 /DNA_END=184 /DNA_ORIENTATION=-